MTVEQQVTYRELFKRVLGLRNFAGELLQQDTALDNEWRWLMNGGGTTKAVSMTLSTVLTVPPSSSQSPSIVPAPPLPHPSPSVQPSPAPGGAARLRCTGQTGKGLCTASEVGEAKGGETEGTLKGGEGRVMIGLVLP